MALNSDSRFNRTYIINVYDRFGRPLRRPFVNLLQRYENVNHPSNRLYRLKDTDRWHQLAYRKYGRGQDYWVILDFNAIVDPFEELIPGKRIVLPSVDVVQFDVKDFEIAEDLTGV